MKDFITGLYKDWKDAQYEKGNARLSVIYSVIAGVVLIALVFVFKKK